MNRDEAFAILNRYQDEAVEILKKTSMDFVDIRRDLGPGHAAYAMTAFGKVAYIFGETVFEALKEQALRQVTDEAR